jgi:hypothetical protein
MTTPVQLIVYGTGVNGLKDTYGRYIDGADNGAAGSNAIAILSSGGATIEAITLVPGAGPITLLAMVDAALESDDLGAVAESRFRATR